MTRASWMNTAGTVSLGRADQGGIFFWGQCRSCNSAAGEVFDPAYGKLATALLPWWRASLDRNLTGLVPVPDVDFKPGAVARSIVLGMCATTTIIRRNWPTVEALLDRSTQVELPARMRLYVALARGRTAWVAGTAASYWHSGPRARRGGIDGPQILMSFSSVFFPPLAWRLIDEDTAMLDDEGWADVSEWCSIAPDAVHNLRNFVTKLPKVRHPRHEPHGDNEWVDQVQGEVSHIIECLDVLDSRSDQAGTRRRTMQRAMVPMEEVEALARERGYSVNDD
ncbi:hypothetical protein AB0H71_31745 [Nocardia sp. NPDC050697]|uniref:hypothetical protein n=1 Tax=Nocardia sp. NPDC050697 TaxID=3155158 RepID=UPI0033FCA6C0